MGTEAFFGGGVDMLYNNSMMGNPFSEPEWNSSHIAPMPHTLDFEPSYQQSRPPPIAVSSIPGHVVNIPRPKSSPSTFGPNVEDLLFTENPFRLRGQEDFPSFTFPMSPVSSKTSSPYYHQAAQDYSHSARASPTPGRHTPVTIAPDPASVRQMHALKRLRGEDDDFSAEFSQRKRKRATSNLGPVELNEEEQLLLKLKEEENLPWKDIAVRFQSDLGKTYQVPALQMRFKRLRERMRTWTDTEISALEQAYDYWEKFQFDIIAAKMLDFGASERWPAKYCARKWDELHPGRGNYTSSPTYLPDPWADSHNCSPVESLMSHSPRPTMPRSASHGL